MSREMKVSREMKAGALTVLAMFTILYPAAISEWQPGLIAGIAGYVFGFLALGAVILLIRQAVLVLLPYTVGPGEDNSS